MEYTLLYKRFLGGGTSDEGAGIAVDRGGNIYIVGYTTSQDFPTTPGSAPISPGTEEVFVDRSRADGTSPVYTVLLGEGGESHGGIAVDEDGSAYVLVNHLGADDSLVKLTDDGTRDPHYADVKVNGLGVDVDGEGNAYVTSGEDVIKIEPNGQIAEESIPFGRQGTSLGIALDEERDIYVTTGSFVIKIGTSEMVSYTASLGQHGIQTGQGIAVDGLGNAYVTGERYVVKVQFDATPTVVYSVPLPEGYRGRAIAVDREGNAFVTGWTADYADAFVVKVNQDGTQAFSTVLRGSGQEYCHGIAADEAGNVYVVGATTSPDLLSGIPAAISVGAYRGAGDAFVLKLAVEGQEPPTPIRGRILLQGRSDHAGTGIYLTEQSCQDTGTPSGAPSAVTTSNGDFEVTPPPNHSYACLQAHRPGYLVGQKGSPQEDLGVITLPAGDVNQDTAIDLEDLRLVAGHFVPPYAAVADFNADGSIDVLDLVIAARNYGARGPVTDWQ